MEKNKSIAVFGGCFNPPLYSHFSLAQNLLNDYPNIEKVIFLPVGNHYNKPNLVSDEHRLNMLKLICDKNEKFEISDLEIRKKVQLDTADSFKELQKEYPQYELLFVAGSDNLAQMSSWNKIEEFFEGFRAIILTRDMDKIEEIISKDKFLLENREKLIFAQNRIITNLSSTYVREQIKNGKDIRYFLPEEILEYIRINNLYI